MKKARVHFFREELLKWHVAVKRPMPWKGEKDPYKIWISEIMLQQTRVEQVIGYYKRFLSLFPDIYTLASASEEEVIKAWEGLGYYRRARHLHQASRTLVKEYKGLFPRTYEDILSLKGIGPYTAAAVSSFAFGIPMPVIDGNVERIIARFEGIQETLTNYTVRKRISQIADQLLDKDRPAAYNQAIMDFGALQCRPGLPDCNICPLKTRCYAHKNNCVGTLPVKTPAKTRKKRYFHYLIIESDQGILFHKRSDKDIWSGMFEPLLIERKVKGTIIRSDVERELKINNIQYLRCIHSVKQTLSHQEIFMYFYKLEIPDDFYTNEPFLISPLTDALENLPMPKSVGCFLKDKWLHLK